MRWLFENPQLLIIIGGAIAYWLNERRKAKEKQAMAEEAERTPTDDEMAERTRRIQEEIRRKIEERAGRAPQPAAFDEAEEDEDNVEGPKTVPPPLPSSRPVLVSAEEAPGAAELERVMEQQRRYAEQLDRLAAEQRAAQSAAAVGGGAPLTMAAYDMKASAVTAPRSSPQLGALLAGLHDRDALRRAIVLREVLGAPKALQP
jgi:hypothetical protein